MGSISANKLQELITRRRRQILVHSVIYYKLNETLISDSQWASWALELEQLQAQYPELAAACPYAKAFADFDHSTGMNLPLDDAWAVHTAQRLVAYARDKNSCFNEGG